MAWFAVTSLMRTVELQFLPPNPHVVLDDTNAAEALHGRLRELVEFLEKSENQFNADEDVPMQDWKARLKDVALRIEDEIESKVIESCSQRQSTSTLAKSSHYILGNAIEELTNSVREEYSQMRGILSSRERIESSSSSSSLHTALELQSTMVGRTAELERIKRLLLDDKSQERLVIPIVGMAGIGKTTFAPSLYQDPLVISHFDVLAWATMSTSATYDGRRMLRELLLCIEPKQKEFIHQVNDDLPNLVRQQLLGQRYLIVLDAIWNSNHWEDIQGSFPEDCNGSRILLTSRHDGVARSYTYCSLNLPFLNSEESWDLFLQKIHPVRLRSEVEAIWIHILNYFKGLPFAIVIVAGLARAINESLWVSKEIEFLSLVLIDKTSLDGKIKTCKVHDIVHDFCKRKAMEEDLLHVVDGHFGNLHIYRRWPIGNVEVEREFNLQTLVLLTKEERFVEYYPTKAHQIWRMPMLRHLQFSRVFMFDIPSVVQEYLQTIYWLRPSQCKKQVFLRIPNAKVMGIFIPRWVEKFDSWTKNWLNDLINLQKLEKLKINSHHDDPIILPHASAFPVQLRMLTLKGTLLPWDAMEVIGMLPNLEVLKLKFGACKGQHWEHTGDWFPKLKVLLIQEMELMQWTATEDAFPILERLIIKHCIHLEKIPSTFVELYSLQLIELHGCHSLLVHSTKEIQQQQEELFGYNWLVVHDYNYFIFSPQLYSLYHGIRALRLSFDEMNKFSSYAAVVTSEPEQEAPLGSASIAHSPVLATSVTTPQRIQTP
ncbi:PREDICTED: putative late blight resistance protein homolog R1A-10 [Ipomoea nil]|uniref:putative late blight resistance protein homolog R1A-10 n=1 Tax=Ipomoea nil TaxID=35883 RepID=UPI00090157DA|nr:PREDICTED: putative late blight resistance protein homolog R1A-10 [Ipomoea nil]